MVGIFSDDFSRARWSAHPRDSGAFRPSNCGVSEISGDGQVVASAGFRILSILARTALPLRQTRTARTLEKEQ